MSCKQGAFLHPCTVRFKPWPRQSAAGIWILKLGVSAANLYSTSNFPQWFGAAFLNVFFFLSAIFYPPTFPTHSFVHKKDGMSREELPPTKKKIIVTNKEQEPIFSDGFKPPATSVSENILNLSNSSFSYSE